MFTSKWNTTMIKYLIALALILGTSLPSNAAGWASIHKYAKKSGTCSNEVLTSYYNTGTRTANGEKFNPNDNTAASRTLPFGTNVTVTNPKNGKSVVVRINDRGPYGIAYRMGARLDLAQGAARRIGMTASQYTCVT